MTNYPATEDAHHPRDDADDNDPGPSIDWAWIAAETASSIVESAERARWEDDA